MLLPISWIKNYVNIDDIETMELTDEFTLTGTHVESVMDLKTGIENVVVGKVLEIREHPNADKLVVVNIDTGDKVHEIVTGAKNMKVDDLVAIAKLGAKLPNGLEIKETELMGVPSPGMLCSYEELGFNKNLVPKNSENGIMILKGDIPLGTNILDVLDMNDALIELEITPNRADCLSMVGLAREIAATFDRKMEMPDTSVEKEVEDIKEYFDGVEIETDNCPRYVARVVKDVVIKESPQWMQNYLMQAGMRPINNIVDITNYVMLELGQPMHAFDINTITNKKIVVRQAKDGEVITTLDKEDRKLTSEDIVIANGDTPVAIAGVMGGLNSEIEEYTDTILIESASFNKSSVRKTAKRLNLRTESSQR
ncbi:MAG: phenylalanine--tRNA ligase subunit beta, partial [Tissierellia bacterium]|nr:phenylalanine--tRNA ligase subunit beta [Tissierellia bacterium]